MYLEYFTGKCQKPLLCQNTLATLPYSLSPIHCSYVTYVTHIDTDHQYSQFVCHHHSLFLLHFWVCFPAQISGPNSFHGIPSYWSQHLIFHNQTINKPFTGWVRIKHVTTSSTVAPQSWVASCTPCTLEFS